MRSSGIRRLGLSAAIVIVTFLAAALMSGPSDIAGPCEVANRATLPDVPEASGLAVSRRHAGVLWTHNDSGHDAVLFAIDEMGIQRGQVQVPARLRDWEAVSAARCGGEECLYIGDIGDNSFARRNVQVLVVREPDPGDVRTTRPVTYAVTYPDGPHNAEAMFIASGRLFIVTRDNEGVLFGSKEPLGDDHNIRLRGIARLGLAAVTDAETSPDDASVAVRTSRAIVVYRTVDLIAGRVNPLVRIPIGGLRESQGEAIALGTNGTVFLASEGGRAGRFIMLHCNLTL